MNVETEARALLEYLQSRELEDSYAAGLLVTAAGRIINQRFIRHERSPKKAKAALKHLERSLSQAALDRD